jgi:hypothetical protein
VRRKVQSYEGTLYFVAVPDRDGKVLAVFPEHLAHHAERLCADHAGANVIDEEGLFVRVMGPDDDVVIPWQGPFDSPEEAAEHLRDEHCFDAAMGMDTDEYGDVLDPEDDPERDFEHEDDDRDNYEYDR